MSMRGMRCKFRSIGVAMFAGLTVLAAVATVMAQSPTGNTYQVSVKQLPGGVPFSDCFQFDYPSAGALTVGNLGGGVTLVWDFDFDDGGAGSGDWQATGIVGNMYTMMYPTMSTYGIGVHGHAVPDTEDDPQRIEGDAIIQTGGSTSDTYFFTGELDPSCGGE